MADRSNARLNEEIESKIRQWDGTIFGVSLKICMRTARAMKVSVSMQILITKITRRNRDGGHDAERVL